VNLLKHVIIGNSAAGIGAVEGIRQMDRLSGITVITNEPHHAYSRPLISYLLLGRVTEEEMRYRSHGFYSDNNCTLLRNASVAGIDAVAKTALLADGGRIPYDKLLVATGSSPFVPPFEGLETVKSKFTFMSLGDARELSAALERDKRLLIVGAGLIGLKCAEGVLRRVRSVTVLDLAPRILSSILDEDGAGLVQRRLESEGLEFRLAANIKRFEGHTAVLDDGFSMDFDILVLAPGVRPNTALLQGIAEIGQGIVVNGKSETTAADIYAAGDCTQTLDVSSGRNKTMALLPNAYMQGECAGINMAGGDVSFDRAMPMNALGFFGLHIITAGSYTGEIYAETGRGSYKRLFYSDNRLNGYILIGDVEKAGIYTSLVRERTPLDTIDFPLVCEKPGLMAFRKEIRTVRLGGAA
jgi:NAD(P)H-nitrite reductase large subunit